jgi:GrpB-like predicted nucleotidyltransferase (UPF0157 family)
MRKYKFRKYSKNYPLLFKKERTRIKKHVPNLIVEHIGSTSVEGLGGKGIIDILVCVSKNDLEKTKEIILGHKYKKSKTGGNKERIFFEKNYGFLKRKKIHIQLTFKGSKTHKEAIKFRNKLRSSKELRGKYALKKQEAVKLRMQGKDYRKFKNKFIQEVLRR